MRVSGLCRLAAIASIAVVGMSATGLAADYSDVPVWHWAWSYIQGVSDAGIAAGYEDGTYQPGFVVTRDQMAVYVARAMCGSEAAVPTGPATPSFSDVDTGYWAYKHIQHCADAAQNIIHGYDDGTYRPTVSVTRDAMAVYISRAIAGGDAAVPAGPGSATFSDADTGFWAFKYIEYCADPEQGVVQGYGDGTYRPAVDVTRDQMAVYVCRAFDLATPTSPGVTLTDYFPLGDGDTWVVKNSTGSTATRTVSGTKQLHGRTCTVILDAANSVGDYWMSAPEGLYRCGQFDDNEDISFDPPFLFPNGMVPGDSGSTTATVYNFGAPVGTTTFNWEFLGLETITVPAGTFADCVRLHLYNPADLNDTNVYVWTAEGVGMVKEDNIASPDDSMELQSANVGGRQYP